ncbi:MAG: Asp-tRNA(Asn)/Glu-tRNA(Gln) amidotransferase subunit GatA [Bdellovibrionales bacterium]|nr:Asp-tRNA(Asn)/Glu-tRNA(Gln) amidotransferase subunit GatA [Bdellovibrionales bacterium]
MDLLTASFSEISAAVREKKVSAVEVTKFFLNRVNRLDQHLNSFISRDETAVKQAESIDQRILRGDSVGALAGIPFGIKDMICTKGLRTTAASKILENFVPPYDATLVERLRGAGAIVLGKLNQDEFAMGSSNETSAFGLCKNPWNVEYVTGGSSGGAGAAKASRLTAGTIGTDTGGSIRQPASFCGVVGVKPTYGRVSRYGIIAYASSLDQAGPMTSYVSDAALTLEVICGRDPMDSTTSNQAVQAYSQNLTSNLTGLKIGLLKEFLTEGLDSEVNKAVDDAVAAAKRMGAEIVEVSVPLTSLSVPIYYLIAMSEASSNLARYDGIKYGYRAPTEGSRELSLEEMYSKTRGVGFGSEVQRRIIIGTYCLSSGYYDAYYNKACQVRRLLKNQSDEAFKKCDVILGPVSTTPAFKIGDRISDTMAMYLNDIFTTSTNLAGLPGMTVPFAISSKRLPIGIQLTAGHFQEQTMLNVGFALEQNSLSKGERPNVY